MDQSEFYSKLFNHWETPFWVPGANQSLLWEYVWVLEIVLQTEGLRFRLSSPSSSLGFQSEECLNKSAQQKRRNLSQRFQSKTCLFGSQTCFEVITQDFELVLMEQEVLGKTMFIFDQDFAT